MSIKDKDLFLTKLPDLRKNINIEFPSKVDTATEFFVLCMINYVRHTRLAKGNGSV